MAENDGREMMDGFQRRKEHNREKITRAAMDLFQKLGIEKVSVTDIARQARVSQVTIYNLFGSKDELVRVCIKEYVNNMSGIFRRIVRSEKTYLEKLEDIFSFFVEISESNRGLRDLDPEHFPQFRSILEDAAQQMFDLLVEYARSGQRAGYLNNDISEDAVRAYIEIFIRGMNADRELHERAHHDPGLFHDLLHLMLFGLSRVDRVEHFRKDSGRPVRLLR